jgi:kinesin family protein 13
MRSQQQSKGSSRTKDDSSHQESRVRVVIRIRPLNDNENARKQKCVLDSDGDQRLTVWDPACFEIAKRQDLQAIDPECWSRDFNFDRCLWSLNPREENYASQDTVFDGTFLMFILDNI